MAIAYSFIVMLISIGCMAVILMLLLIVAITVPVDFSKWTVVFLVLFIVLFTFMIAALLTLSGKIVATQMDLFYAFIIVFVLSAAMLLNLQVLFNGAIFELYPDDFILGAIFMLADVMWVHRNRYLIPKWQLNLYLNHFRRCEKFWYFYMFFQSPLILFFDQKYFSGLWFINI